MEDQIIGIICVIALFVAIGFITHKKRKYGENAPDAKYSKGRI
ncbi:hypothetical protein [Sulfuricurvum sp.]|nr:hypothetical protein [Sulfuricurvum sp.]HEX5328863.1 hypothetical protein [Sulfuricurvum sp.]